MTEVMTSYTAAYGTTTALRPVQGDSPPDILLRPGSVLSRQKAPKPRRMPLLSSPPPVFVGWMTLDLRASIMLNVFII